MALQFGRSRLPELLHRKGMYPVDLAAALGVTESLISQVIKGKARFSIITAKNAAFILGCKIDDLWEWIDDGIR
jgi:transcriptional regulator with XRE-family HTH domain